MYLANNTRPDITFAVHFLARFQKEPLATHYRMVKKVVRYLSGTLTFGLKYNHTSTAIIDTYVDASFCDDKTMGKSTTGYLIRFRGNLVAWRSRQQVTSTESTTEAEYMAITDAAHDILFLSRLTEEMTLQTNIFPIPLFEDNTGCIAQTTRTSRGRLRHLEKKYLDYRKLFDQGLLQAHKVDGQNQLADILTKPLPHEIFTPLRNQLLTQVLSLEPS